MAPPLILEKIRKDLIESAQDDRYRLGAYEFVLNGLDFYLTGLGEKRHVSGQELSKSLLTFAHRQFGPLARSVLRYWGIDSTDDFGYIVYNMISIGVMSKQSEDSLDHFFDVTDVDLFFETQSYYPIDPDFIKKVKGA